MYLVLVAFTSTPKKREKPLQGKLLEALKKGMMTHSDRKYLSCLLHSKEGLRGKVIVQESVRFMFPGETQGVPFNTRVKNVLGRIGKI